MKQVEKVLISAFATLAIGLSSSASAEGVVFMPVLKDGYQPDAVLSVIAGTMQPTEEDADSLSIVGAELSFRCVLLQMGDNQLRQQLSFTTGEKNNLTLQNLEINAHYQIPVANDVKIGVGPGLGLMMTDAEGSDNPTFYGVQVGASVHYTGMGPAFLGAEWRYQLTNEDKFVSGGAEDNMNNWRAAVKVGYMF